MRAQWPSPFDHNNTHVRDPPTHSASDLSHVPILLLSSGRQVYVHPSRGYIYLGDVLLTLKDISNSNIHHGEAVGSGGGQENGMGIQQDQYGNRGLWTQLGENQPAAGFLVVGVEDVFFGAGSLESLK